MVKRLTRHGNSLALVIEKAVLELLDIGADTPLTVTTDGTRLMITPIRRARRLRGGGARSAARIGEAGAEPRRGHMAATARASDPSDRSAAVYTAAVRALSLEQKLRVSEGLRALAWQLKAGSLARQHPDWSQDEVNRRVAEAFLRGRA